MVLRLAPGLVMIFGPCDAAELEIVAGIAHASHSYVSYVAGG